ncbi:hypothetical protein THAOC_11360 [Thalassiosira oceanica]|uniref:J domain-containing protein n=1 Tax=Thalassiosira oceanica TaxID=159749 RepID=K0SRH9_THAOC|nr:hypothetical protein THAOC_11360 [Thalassiosira oceanica]|eukprot:EJK67584.1 hypothetical protein THAOC_11360 [Thalassiosira oceanica]
MGSESRTLRDLEVWLHRMIRKILGITIYQVMDDHSLKNDRIRKMFGDINCIQTMIDVRRMKLLGDMIQGKKQCPMSDKANVNRFLRESSPYPEGPTLALILVTRHGIQTAAERNRIGMHTSANSAGNNAMKIIAEGRRSEGGNSKTIVNNERSGMSESPSRPRPSSGIDDPDLDPSNMEWNLDRAHKVLGHLGRNATSREIKMAYRLESRRWHPDHHHVGKPSFKEAEACMQTINAAYEYPRELSRT